ncbi:siroheme synthase [Novosphingobium sp. G106]|uniref:precorrin-2 dehydrogenase/sirohydrochlorin ferrochelatase family protein n=1 Tax=Novosphingobium sp. G106 TaxID=2849500 RepID=UPI001C2D24F3|nr:NAD(P)-dependent oxidoreductase [Novosphingobium sp. G106]MBV1691135.1 siroheme synthase [Novosphingobium sp. G106]
MIQALPLFHRIAGQPVIVLGEGEAAEAKRRLVERAGGVVVSEENQAARLAFVALDAPEEAAARLRARGLLVNVVDRPELCDFTAPSILDRSPVLIAIGTGGASAGLAKALRLRLEALLPQALGRLAEGLGAARTKLGQRWPDAGDRRRALDAALGEGGALDPLRADSADRIDAWLGEASGVEPSGVVEIRLRSGDPEDLTLREARLLGSADLLAHEAGVPEAVLERARADAARVVVVAGEAPPERQGLVIVIRI